ncbi:MAG: 4'-phosphopantetheinyl transferase [Pseudanabaena frigida]|uniref:4'-phosphopantetheinyl transferase n=1 Tax=Pseudanabaena frigida TaxID=945775 RepID=A0A2W4W8M1_9CYAN|nr:MAG: 4'-phosphopantetheinyl transferase [Pseudanabaena frigida]
MMSKDLQLYQVKLDIAEIEVDRLWQFLSADERSRADRFKREYLKRNFVAARGNLRIILAQKLGCQPNEIQFSYSDRGKPYIEGTYFNLAHSQDLAIYAVCGDREVGIDLEYINFECEVDRIAQRYFLPSEQKTIKDLGDRNKHEQYLAFYRAWTLKEAYGKATGKGIANGLDIVDVASLLEMPSSTLQIGEWTLKLISSELEIDRSYAAALCIAS